jgi:Mg2+ and Co2+ transporter CorA
VDVKSKIDEAPAGIDGSISIWVPGRSPTGYAEPDVRPQGGVLWCDLKQGISAQEAHDLLAPHCGERLTEGMLEQLLRPDEAAQVESFDGGSIRITSACEVWAEDEESGSEDDPVGALVVARIELLASDKWLVTHRHKPRRQFGREGEQLGPPSMELESDAASRWRERFAGVARRWQHGTARTGGDLGILVMHELALTYIPTVRQLYSWLERWEYRLYEQDPDAEQLKAQRRSLRELWILRAVLRNWINPLERPDVEEDPETVWLPVTYAPEAKHVEEHIEGGLKELANLGDSLRGSFHVLHGEELEEERQQKEELHRRLEVIAAIILIPSFIVGFYGANTWVPGEHQEWGLAVMLGAMVVLTAVAVALLTVTRDR